MNFSLAVIDSNIAIHTVLATELSGAAAALMAGLKEKKIRLFAPHLWVYEVTSGIHKQLQGKLLTAEEAEEALNTALAFDIKLAEDSPALCLSAFQWASRLGQLAAYDGFYLALAEQLDCLLWTGDRRLVNSAKQLDLSWVRWMDEAGE